MIINWNWYCITHQAGIDIEIGIAEKPYLVFLLLLILQIHVLSYWYWYCNCKTLLADVDIDVAIAIQLNPISLLVLVLQNHHLNIEDQTISEILVLRSPAKERCVKLHDINKTSNSVRIQCISTSNTKVKYLFLNEMLWWTSFL